MVRIEAQFSHAGRARNALIAVPSNVEAETCGVEKVGVEFQVHVEVFAYSDAGLAKRLFKTFGANDVKAPPGVE